jgi:hypothetical protein
MQYAESFIVTTESLKARKENSYGKCIVVQINLLYPWNSSELPSIYQQELGHTALAIGPGNAALLIVHLYNLEDDPLLPQLLTDIQYCQLYTWYCPC